MLRAISPLHQVTEGAVYPPLLITAAPDETTIALSQPGKLAARLQAATPVGPIGKPVLMRVAREGHDEDLADIFSFLLWALDEK